MSRSSAFAMIAVAALCGALACSSVDVTERDEYEGGQLPRPSRIIVHDFAATPSDLPEWAEARRTMAGATSTATADELEVGRKLGAAVAHQLVVSIAELGLPAVAAAGQSAPRTNDLVLVGAFTSVEQGSTGQRVVIGFGSGDAELRTHVAAYRETGGRLVKLGSGTLDAGGGTPTPGLAVPALVTVATANPIGLVIGGGAKLAGEVSGRDTIEGVAKRTAEQIVDELEVKLREQGWID